MDPFVRNAVRAVIGEHRYLLLYAERRKLNEGDVAGAATALLRRSRLAVGFTAVCTVVWLALLALGSRSHGGYASGMFWWTLILIPPIIHQARVAATMRTVLAFLAAAESRPTDSSAELPQAADAVR